MSAAVARWGGRWLVILPALAILGAGGAPRSMEGLRTRLVRAGRAEVSVRQVVMAGGDTVRQMRGRLALELPDRVRVDDPRTGERLTARGDGGEWLQPAAEQMLILRAEQASQVASVWRIMLEGSRDVEERALGSGRFVMRAKPGAQAFADSVWVRLGKDGLPTVLEATTGDEHWRLEFGAWKFARPRGASAFKLHAPTGYAVVEWP
jgi:hypothetical protein